MAYSSGTGSSTSSNNSISPPPLSFVIEPSTDVLASDEEWKRYKDDLGPPFPPQIDYHHVEDVWVNVEVHHEDPVWCREWTSALCSLGRCEELERLRRIARRDTNVVRGRENRIDVTEIKAAKQRKLERSKRGYRA